MIIRIAEQLKCIGDNYFKGGGNILKFLSKLFLKSSETYVFGPQAHYLAWKESLGSFRYYLLLTSKMCFIESLGLFKMSKQLVGVGPVDNRPYIDKLHYFVQK